jgi:hypothetical protein
MFLQVNHNRPLLIKGMRSIRIESTLFTKFRNPSGKRNAKGLFPSIPGNNPIIFINQTNSQQNRSSLGARCATIRAHFHFRLHQLAAMGARLEMLCRAASWTPLISWTNCFTAYNAVITPISCLDHCPPLSRNSPVVQWLQRCQTTDQQTHR